jgi:hypothetical protein
MVACVLGVGIGAPLHAQTPTAGERTLSPQPTASVAVQALAPVNVNASPTRRFIAAMSPSTR